MKPTIYRITHLWPNKQPGHGSTTAQIEQDRERWMIKVCRTCGFESLVRKNPQESALGHAVHAGKDGEATVEEVEVVPAPEDSSTVQIIPETDELDALPSRFVSLQDYERLERGEAMTPAEQGQEARVQRWTNCERALEALASLVREEWPSHYTLAEIAETWGVGITPEQVKALRDLETQPPDTRIEGNVFIPEDEWPPEPGEPDG